MPRRNRLWGFPDEARPLLLEATFPITDLYLLIYNAQERPDLAKGMWLVTASKKELDQIYTVVTGLTAGHRSGKQRELLEGLLASLCSSIDGF